MSDLLTLAATIVLFTLAISYMHACDLLTRNRKPTPHA